MFKKTSPCSQLIIFLIAYFILFGAYNLCAQENSQGNSLERPSTISPEQLNNLISSGKIRISKVLIKNQDDVDLLQDTGAVIMTQEQEYVVILGNQKILDAVISKGFSLIEPQEKDHKLRMVKFWVESQTQLKEIRRIASDIWPGGTVPGYIIGRAYDHEIRWLQGKGIIIERIYK